MNPLKLTKSKHGGGGQSRRFHNKVVGVFLGLGIIGVVVGTSYALWNKTYRQKDPNTIRTECFKVQMMNETEGITIENASPVSDEKGKNYDGYTFTIKNVCSAPAYYQVNLEELIEEKKLPNEYIRISLNDSKGKNLNTYKEVDTTIENTDMSHKLTSGALRANEEVTYTLKLWMDENTPPIKETMDAIFKSKVSVITIYKNEADLKNNNIKTVVGSKNDAISGEKEVITINAKSDKYDITGYSLDGINYYPVESGKDVNIDVTITDEGKHIIYVKDEVGNIKEIEVDPTKLDKTAPSIEIEANDKQETIELTISFSDEKSGLYGYKITESNIEPTEWDSFDTTTTTADTKTVAFIINKNTAYYIWVKDKAGNVNYKAYSSSTIDTKAPNLEVRNTLTSYGLSDTITISAVDDVIGISGVSITKSEEEYNFEAIEGSPLEYSKTVEVEENGTYYISVKDSYDHITTKSIVIDKVDREAPSNSFSIASSKLGSNSWYKDLSIKVDLTDNLSGIKSAKYCVTTDNECTPNIDATISNNSYTVALSSNANAQKICSLVTDNVTNTSLVQCSSTYKVDTTDPSQSFSVASSTSGSNGWYTALAIKVSVNDSHSGVASAKYCITTSSTCTPSTSATISSNAFNVTLGTNASVQKVCSKVTDNAGRTSSIACSITYKVDTDNPIAKIATTPGSSSVTLSASGSSDTGSGIATYYYSRDGGSTWQTSTTNTYTFSSLDIKEYIFAIKVVDNAGRTSEVVTKKDYPSSKRETLYEQIAASASLDNTSSEFVTASTGIDFAVAPSDTNGKGVYTITDTKDSKYPVHYFRGAVTNNNVKFANFCWKIVRTTETGGVKLIYNGTPNESGGCTNTTRETLQIGNGAFNTSHSYEKYVGYMYPESTNAISSTIKIAIDTWYETNMTTYTKYLEDTVWCNDRSVYSTKQSNIYYGAYGRNVDSVKPSIVCPNDNDKFTVSGENGNGKLTYPVALLTADEATLAGHGRNGFSDTSYLCTNQDWWLLSPDYVVGTSVARGFLVFANGTLGDFATSSLRGFRPSVSLAPGIMVKQGNGTSSNPFEIETN